MGDMNLRVQREPEAADATFVYVPNKTIKYAPIIRSEKTALELALEKMPEGQKAAALENIRFSLFALGEILVASRKNGASEKKINEALSSLLGKDRMLLDYSVDVSRLSDHGYLPELLRALGASKKNISPEWIEKTLKETDTALLSLQGKENKTGALDAHIEASHKNSLVAERVGYVAILAYKLQENGLRPMGEYRLGINDCFDFCQFALLVARGIRGKRNIILEESGNGMISAEWFIAKSVEDKLPEKSAEEMRSIRRTAKDKFLNRKWGNGSILKVFSVSDPGSFSGEHWGIFYGGYVYDFVGSGIRKTPVSEFEKEGGAMRYALNPLDEKEVPELASEKIKKPPG
ncbi:MAG: hypothetical protein ABIF01_03990 [Candidatus Micrarchaeota archaeon]